MNEEIKPQFGEMKQEIKKSFLRRFWWQILVFILFVLSLIIVVTIINNHNNDIRRDQEEADKFDKEKESQNNNINIPYRGPDTKDMTDAQLNQVNSTLTNGVKIEDLQNDWYHFPTPGIEGDGKPDNQNPYPLSYTDLKSISFGADVNYFYFKFEYWEKQPTSMQTFNEDDIKSLCNNVAISKYIDKNGKSQVGMFQLGTFYLDSNEQKSIGSTAIEITSVIGMGIWGEQTGTDETNEATYAVTSTRGLVYGGPGYDFAIIAVPLDVLNLKIGDTITFDIEYETNSKVYHHEAIDQVLGDGQFKTGDTIQYVIGSNTFTDLGIPENERALLNNK